MLLASVAVVLGFVALVFSADYFISGAASMAKHWGMPKLLIGLTIVAFGTSAPEMLVSLFAALDGSGNLAAGNALGSNLANIGMVLGITAIIAAIPVGSRLIRNEIPVYFLVCALAGWVLFDGEVTFFDGVLLVLGLTGFMVYLFKMAKSGNDGLVEDEAEIDELSHHSFGKAVVYFVLGLAVLLISANVLVWGAKQLALAFGVSELVIGLTVVAIGTSLPELAASVSSALKGHHEIAFGNVIGSNVFNLLVVLGLPGLIAPFTLDASVFGRDFVAMMILSVLWFVMMLICVKRGKPFGKFMGVILLLGYFAYYWVLFQQG